MATNTVSVNDLRDSAFIGDTGSGGRLGLVPAPAAGDATKVLKGDATWGTAGASITTKAELDAAITDDNVAYLGTVQAFTKTQSVAPTALSVASNLIAYDMALSNNATVTLQATTGQTLSNPTNIVAGTSGQITVTQNATPSTLAYGTYWKFVDGVTPTVSTTAGAVNTLTWYADSTTYITCALNKHGVA